MVCGARPCAELLGDEAIRTSPSVVFQLPQPRTIQSLTGIKTVSIVSASHRALFFHQFLCGSSPGVPQIGHRRLPAAMMLRRCVCHPSLWDWPAVLVWTTQRAWLACSSIACRLTCCQCLLILICYSLPCLMGAVCIISQFPTERAAGLLAPKTTLTSVASLTKMMRCACDDCNAVADRFAAFLELCWTCSCITRAAPLTVNNQPARNVGPISGFNR